MINSRDIKDLDPRMVPLCKKFIADCKSAGIDIIITSTYRDYMSQRALFFQGRTTPGKIVTNAKPGESFHNFRVAFDFCPIVNGKAQFNDLATFKRCGAIAEGIGLEWAGRWKTFKEYGHCQLPGQDLKVLQNKSRLL